MKMRVISCAIDTQDDKYIKRRMRQMGFKTRSEYVRFLISQDMNHWIKNKGEYYGS